MIRIYYPQSRSYFGVLQDLVIGPLSLTGLSPYQTIEYRCEVDNLVQGKTIGYHEKGVSNVQVFADLECSDMIGSISAAPTTNYPDRVEALSGSNAYYASFGIAGNRACSRYVAGSASYKQVCMLEDNKWVLYRVGRNLYTSWAATCTKIVIPWYVDAGSVKAIVSIEQNIITQSKYWIDPGWDWSSASTADEVLVLYFALAAAPGTKSTSSSSQTYPPKILSEKSHPTLPSLMTKVRVVASHMIRQGEIHPTREEPGAIALRAVEKVNDMQLNAIAFLRDMRKPAEMLPNLKGLHPKELSSDLLAVKYGILPTVDDCKAILDGFRTLSQAKQAMVVRDGSTTSETIGLMKHTLRQQMKVQLQSRDETLCRLMNSFDNLGLAPTGKNLWDLIPYSFVLDWFVDVGQYLRELDSIARVERYRIHFSVYSEKVETQQDYLASDLPTVVGEIKTVAYHRWASSQCPVPSLTTLNTQFELPKHGLEAAAMIFQRRR